MKVPNTDLAPIEPLRSHAPFTRKAFMVRIAAGVAAGFALSTAAFAQTDYPSKPIRIIVPYTAGGTVDSAARLIGKQLGESLGQTVLIDNRPGASGTIGADAVANAQPDGYTLLMVPSAHVINPAVMANVPFDVVKDFTPIAIVGTLPLVFISGAQQPFKTLQEMVAYAKARPGELALGYTDASTQLVGEMLKQAAGLKMKMVPYKGGSAMATDVIGGHVQLGATGAGSAYPHHKAGTVRVLGVTESKRAPSMPEVPTVAESGVPGFDAKVWLALLGPAKLPPAIVTRLNSELSKVIADPKLAARMREMGTVPRVLTPAQTRATMEADVKMWAKTAKAAGLKPQ